MKKICVYIVAFLIIGICFKIISPIQPIIAKNKIIFVEIVTTPQQRAKGLKGRARLGEDRGMLFIFEKEKHVSFWMKDTIIPLSIAFLNEDKVIVDIQQMEPLQTDIRYKAAKKSKYALEMNVGWFDENNIQIGDKIVF
ncbi:MAG: DUF192 domain-containing protein [PVC group bacterium]|nr:DUF192 domain-containing protein [PVC group bacterium]